MTAESTSRDSTRRVSTSSDSTSSDSTWTVARLLQWTEGHFQRLGIETARLDAELLLAESLACNRLSLYTSYERPVGPDERDRFRAFVERRSRREPVAYLTGRKEFYSLPFQVDASVLIPRPETEHLVDEALEILRGVVGTDRVDRAGDEDASSALVPEDDATAHRTAPSRDVSSAATGAPDDGREGDTETLVPTPLSTFRVLDLGTGSGAIAVAIAHSEPRARVTAVEIEPAAARTARANIASNGVEDRVTVVEGDLFGALEAGEALHRPFRLIVSNPPYIAAADYEGLMDDVRRHEPRSALLDSRRGDGLGYFAEIAASASRWLEPGGSLVLEVGAGQAAEVESLLRAAGLVKLRRRRDYARIDRVVIGERPETPGV